MSITFEDEQGNVPFTPMRAAELASAKRQTSEYISARVSDSEEVEEDALALTPLKAAAIAAAKYKSAWARCPCPACSRLG